MVSQTVWIGIIIAVFFVGIGVSYAVFEANNPSTFMALTPQQMIQMMNDPQTQQMMSDPETQQMMSQLMQSPQFQQQMMEQMGTMMNDPQQRQQMMTMMMQNQEFMQDMMNNDQMMDMMNSMISGSMMMGSGMMGDGMMSDSMMSNMQFNLDVPINMPMIDGYHNGEKMFFIHTEVSDKNMADMMSMMINFPTLHVSDLTSIPKSEMSKVYVFTNGIPGSGPYGGGPFMFQIDVFDSIPGQMGYSQFRVPHLVTWNDDSTPRVLTSVDEILEAESNGELTIQKTDNVVNAPMIVWKVHDDAEQITATVYRMFESMPGVNGEVLGVDVDNYLVKFKLHSQNDMGMMGQGMMNP